MPSGGVSHFPGVFSFLCSDGGYQQCACKVQQYVSHHSLPCVRCKLWEACSSPKRHVQAAEEWHGGKGRQEGCRGSGVHPPLLPSKEKHPLTTTQPPCRGQMERQRREDIHMPWENVVKHATSCRHVFRDEGLQVCMQSLQRGEGTCRQGREGQERREGCWTMFGGSLPFPGQMPVPELFESFCSPSSQPPHVLVGRGEGSH